MKLQAQLQNERIYLELSKETRILRVSIKKIIKKKKEIIFNFKLVLTQRCCITGRTRGLVKFFTLTISRMIINRLDTGSDIEQSIPFIGTSINKKIRRGKW